MVYKCLEVLQTYETPGSIYQSLVRSDEANYLSWVLAALTPLSAVSNPQPQKVGAKLPLPFATNVAREGIKADNKVCNVVTAAFRNAEAIIRLKLSILKKEPFVTERDTLGMLIRKWDSQGGHWRVQVLFALLVTTLVKANHNVNLGLCHFGSAASSADIFTDYESDVFVDWQKFIDHLESMDLMDAASIKPILDGKRLQKDLDAGPGPWMKEALDVCMAWQMRNPELSESDPENARCEAVEEVRRRREELKIPVKKK